MRALFGLPYSNWRRNGSGCSSHAPNGRSDMGVKASGGARSLEDTLAFIEAGATRIRHHQV